MKNKSIINEWYYPDNFETMPDVITLYHGTDYWGLEEIIESGFIDARKGRCTGETKGMNWFFTEYKTNFSRGFVFSIDIHKDEINKTNNGFRFMNGSEVANYETINIQNCNFKICEAFDLTYEDLLRIWNIQLKKTNNNIEDAFYNFVNYFQKYYDECDVFVDDAVIIQLMKQFGVINELKNIGLTEHRIIESPDTAISPNGGYIFYNERQAIPFIITNDFSNCYLGDSAWTHDDIVTYDGDNDIEISVMDDLELNRTNAWLGRLWMKDKVISIWRIPTAIELEQIIEQLSYYIYEDLYEWYIDINDDEPTLISDYIESEQNNNDMQHFDTNILHLKNGIEKTQDPQMQAYLKSRSENQTNKLGMPNNKREVSPAEYNYYKRYNMGEGKLNEVDSSDINLSSFDPKDELHPKLWINDKLNSRVRLRLLDIADDFIDTLSVDWVKPKDIVFTGSLANYNWSRYSDIDLHIILDYSKVYKKKVLVDEYLSKKKDMWSTEHPKLKIYGYPVEIYVEDSDGDNTSSGVYSLNKNKWLKEPIDFQDVKLNEKYVKKSAAKIMTDIDNIIKKISKSKTDSEIEKYNTKLKNIFNKIKNIRKEGLKKGGEMSSGNIIFKILRRTKYIDKIWDTINTSYDKINSINENK